VPPRTVQILAGRPATPPPSATPPWPRATCAM